MILRITNITSKFTLKRLLKKTALPLSLKILFCHWLFF